MKKRIKIEITESSEKRVSKLDIDRINRKFEKEIIEETGRKMREREALWNIEKQKTIDYFSKYQSELNPVSMDPIPMNPLEEMALQSKNNLIKMKYLNEIHGINWEEIKSNSKGTQKIKTKYLFDLRDKIVELSLKIHELEERNRMLSNKVILFLEIFPKLNDEYIKKQLHLAESENETR